MFKFSNLSSQREGRDFFCIANRAIKLHVKEHYDLSHCLMVATPYYLTLNEYDRRPKLSHCNE